MKEHQQCLVAKVSPGIFIREVSNSDQNARLKSNWVNGTTESNNLGH